jgi:hypothetical protein
LPNEALELCSNSNANTFTVRNNTYFRHQSLACIEESRKLAQETRAP